MAMKKRTKVTSSTTEKVISTKPAVKEPVVKKEPAVKETVAKEAVVKEPVVKEAEVKEDAKKATVKETAAKKPAAKKPAVKKEIKVKAVVEYYGKQVDEKDIIANVKKAWTKSGRKVSDIKTMELYIKPEEAAVYYVINGTETGAVAF